MPQGFCLRFARLESFWKKGLVEFWEFLEPSPKEGSKRGLGQSPKVFLIKKCENVGGRVYKDEKMWYTK